MSLRRLQKEVDNWIRQNKISYFKPEWILARLVEENGELAREINHLFGPKKKKKSEQPSDGLAGELGDIIYTVICLANSQKIDLDRAFKATIKKYKTRDKGRYGRK